MRNSYSSLPNPGYYLDWRKSLRRRVLLPIFRHYAPMKGRGRFCLVEFQEFLRGSVLDVGAGINGPLFKERLGSRYTALDLGRSYQFSVKPHSNDYEPNYYCDLEHELLPFPDRSFDTVICLDVLEHLDNIYRIYNELFRVSKHYIIVSLPNNWVGMLYDFFLGRSVARPLGYGLPSTPPLPGQRHKYFFNLEQACDFLILRAPPDFHLKKLDLRFQRGADGLIFMPPFPVVLQTVKHIKPGKYRQQRGILAYLKWLAAYTALYLPLRFVDVLLTGIIWGLGRPIRFYNIFCSQIWVVFELDENRSR